MPDNEKESDFMSVPGLKFVSGSGKQLICFLRLEYCALTVGRHTCAVSVFFLELKSSQTLITGKILLQFK